MLLAPAWVFPLTLPRPFAPAACGAAQPWHHAGSPLPTGRGVPADREGAVSSRDVGVQE